jgi:hypothetical protein
VSQVENFGSRTTPLGKKADAIELESIDELLLIDDRTPAVLPFTIPVMISWREDAMDTGFPGYVDQNLETCLPSLATIIAHRW